MKDIKNVENNSNSQELTIITGFFDCKRGERTFQKRTNEQYIDYFKSWARIKNKVIVYTTQEFAGQVEKIRNDYGRGEETQIVIVDDITEKEPELFEAMKKIEERGLFQKVRYYEDYISNTAMYDYVILMKFWMLRDTVIHNRASGMLVWLDFGWNHGGDLYVNDEEFDFLWKYQFNHNKVHIFSMTDLSNEMGFLKLIKMTNDMMASPIACPADKVDLLFNFMKEAMWGLISLDFIDNEQMLMTMVYKIHPDFFELHISKGWFYPMKECGGEHLTIKQEQKLSKSEELKRKLKEYGIGGFLFRAYLKIFRKMNYPCYKYYKRFEKLFGNYYKDW